MNNTNSNDIRVNELQTSINILILTKTVPNIQAYLELIRECVDLQEFGATVYVYDHLLAHKITPTEDIFTYINKLHTKTLAGNSFIRLPLGKPSLQPRRRIHKIMKGHLYSDQYTAALLHVDKVINYLMLHPTIAVISNRFKLAKHISKNCSVSGKDAKYIITHLKRKKFFSKFENQSKMTDYFK